MKNIGASGILKRIGTIFLGILVFLSIVPYLIPLPRGGERPPMPFDNSAYAAIHGIELHYRVWEPPEIKGKVLLVHGLGGSTFSWRHNIPALQEKGYWVAAVDLPGFGYSSRERGLDHSQENRAQILWDLLHHIDMAHGLSLHQWDLVGHSMGGGTVAAMTVEKPQSTRSITLVAGALYGRREGPLTAILRFPPAARWLDVAAGYFILQPSRIEGVLTSAYGERPSSQAVEGYLKPLVLPGTVGALVDMTLTSGPSIKKQDMESIAAPVLLVWGENDSWVPVDLGRQLAGDLPSARLEVIPGTGHCPMETEPGIFNSILMDFLDGIPVPAAKDG